MESTLKIALGTGNEPVINFEVVSSDDVRDQLCSQWLHGLCFESNLCHVLINGNTEPGPSTKHLLKLTPLPPNSHYISHQRVEEVYNILSKNRPDITMVTGGGKVGFYSASGNGPGVEMDREELRQLDIIDLVKKVSETFESVARTQN